VIFKPIEVADCRRQLKEYGLPPANNSASFRRCTLTFGKKMFVGADDVIETINDGGRAQESLVFCRLPEGNHALLIFCAAHKK
jgi:hypothetical protein